MIKRTSQRVNTLPQTESISPELQRRLRQTARELGIPISSVEIAPAEEASQALESFEQEGGQ